MQVSDTERLNWLENEGYGAAIVNDDNGHRAVVFYEKVIE